MPDDKTTDAERALEEHLALTRPGYQAEPGTAYHETITAFRRDLIQGHLRWAKELEEIAPQVQAWRDAHRQNPDTPRLPDEVMTAYGASMMAAGYAYVLAAVIKLAQDEPGITAQDLAGLADDLLTNGDFDNMNADVFREGEQPGGASQGLELVIPVPAPEAKAAEAVTSDA